ncbi:MAG: glucan 1,4-alpha-glucosidase [Pleurocapsa sp.]
MVKFFNEKQAFGAPGIEPRWTHANKEGVGTAYSTSSRIWFTIWNGVITEIYYPTVDLPQVRDLQFLISDGKSFFHEEKRHLESQTERMWHHALGYRITNVDPQQRYQIIKEIICDPHLPCILQQVKVKGDAELLSNLQLYVLCAPHLEVGGWGNNAQIVSIAGRKILTAQKGGTWLAIAATVPFSHLSCGYVGQSDGWTDLADNYQLGWEFDSAKDGNVALTGQLDLGESYEFTLGIAFGTTVHNAISTLLQSLSTPFQQHQEKFQQQWQRTCDDLLPLEKVAGDRGNLYYSSYSLLLAHEDKSYPGALIASMAIPWGEIQGDGDRGGYHLVWTRDMVSSTAGLMAAGHNDTAVRSLVYLATTQEDDGGFAQNFWIDGEAYWTGIQLDEVAFPILLAWKLHQENALVNFDIYPMILKATEYLIRQGPATQQERWEENGGYSPSTLAACIAALICAACIVRERRDENTAQFIEEYADFLESHIEAWTVTTEGTLVPGIKQHYIRITPADVNDPHPQEDPNHATIYLTSRPPNENNAFPAKEIVDGGFLQLVRYGIRKPDDPIIVNSVKVIDAVIKVDTPFGPLWHRYNHDGYGQREDGSPYDGWGKGRGWPLLTGERGHYELALGNDVTPYIRAMEGFASNTGLLPEQSWDEENRADIHMYLGRPTDSAMPLQWAHAEYIKLLRSTHDGRVCDFIPEVAERYLENRTKCKSLEVWKFNRQVQKIKPGDTLRIQAIAPFRLRWTVDEWSTVEDTASNSISLNIYFVDLPTSISQTFKFTFFWTDSNNWEGRNYQVAVK